MDFFIRTILSDPQAPGWVIVVALMGIIYTKIYTKHKLTNYANKEQAQQIVNEEIESLKLDERFKSIQSCFTCGINKAKEQIEKEFNAKTELLQTKHDGYFETIEVKLDMLQTTLAKLEAKLDSI